MIYLPNTTYLEVAVPSRFSHFFITKRIKVIIDVFTSTTWHFSNSIWHATHRSLKDPKSRCCAMLSDPWRPVEQYKVTAFTFIESYTFCPSRGYFRKPKLALWHVLETVVSYTLCLPFCPRVNELSKTYVVDICAILFTGISYENDKAWRRCRTFARHVSVFLTPLLEAQDTWKNIADYFGVASSQTTHVTVVHVFWVSDWEKGIGDGSERSVPARIRNSTITEAFGVILRLYSLSAIEDSSTYS